MDGTAGLAGTGSAGGAVSAPESDIAAGRGGVATTDAISRPELISATSAVSTGFFSGSALTGIGFISSGGSTIPVMSGSAASGMVMSCGASGLRSGKGGVTSGLTAGRESTTASGFLAGGCFGESGTAAERDGTVSSSHFTSEFNIAAGGGDTGSAGGCFGGVSSQFISALDIAASRSIGSSGGSFDGGAATTGSFRDATSTGCKGGNVKKGFARRFCTSCASWPALISGAFAARGIGAAGREAAIAAGRGGVSRIGVSDAATAATGCGGMSVIVSKGSSSPSTLKLTSTAGTPGRYLYT